MTTHRPIACLLANNRQTNNIQPAMRADEKDVDRQQPAWVRASGRLATMTRRRRRTKGHCQCLESLLAASRASHRHAEEELRKLVTLAVALNRRRMLRWLTNKVK
jgi:hypothetical protein